MRTRIPTVFPRLSSGRSSSGGPEGSYTTYLFDGGLDKILKKGGEEATETIVAAENQATTELVAEASDLLYHLMVLLVERGVTLGEVTRKLKQRHASKPRTD